VERLRQLQKRLAAEAKGLRPADLAKREAEVEREQELVTDLTQFCERLGGVVQAGYEPNHDDGVLLNFAPLHALTPWAAAAECWQELLAGEYAWSHIGRRLRDQGVV
jgi:hypothetical protein